MFATTAVAAEGDLDPSFGGGGQVRTTVGSNVDETAVAIDSQGRIVVVGSDLAAGDFNFVVARYLPTGALDPAFSGDGLADFDFPPNNGNDTAEAVAIDSQGRILVAGDTTGTGGTDFGLIRVEPDGSLDTSFGPPGSNGFVKQDIDAANDVAAAVAIDSSGRIVLGGFSQVGGDNDFSVARFAASGDLDTTFNATGSAPLGPGKGTYDFTPGCCDDDQAHAMAIDAQGRILLAGESDTASADDFALARVNPDGSRDATFGPGTPNPGEVTTPIGASSDTADAVTIDPQGRVVAAGSATVGGAFGRPQFATARYNPNGSLDATFSNDGKVITPVNDNDRGRDVGVDSQGRIVVVGLSITAGGPSAPDIAIVRYTPGGFLDPAFSGDGKATAPNGDGADAAFDDQDRIVVTGTTIDSGGHTVGFGLARFIGDATAPTATIGSGLANGAYTNDPTPTFSFSSSELGSTFSCGFDGLQAACISPFTPGAPLGDGAHTFSLTATDRAGNASTPATRTFTVDTRKPELKIKGKAKVKTAGRKGREKLKLKANEPSTFTCKVDRKKAKRCSAKYKTPKLKLGKHKLKVTATDRAGNKASKTKKLKVVRAR